ncbi:MAG: aryl-sulfate sulfotransferase [Flammeovirgaceae bacterium]|nr:MAG: aryl-sulfate sulfotransferase [Flammeovirgaceae bacterium]
MRVHFILLMLALIAWACQSSWYSEPEITFLNGNVLLPQIRFSTTDSVSVCIEYWPVHNTRLKHASKASLGKYHEVILVNLKPNTQYAYHLVNERGQTTSEEYTFTTDSVPGHIVRVKKDIIDTTLFNGYILIRRFFKQGADVLLNQNGDIVWYHEYDTAVRRAFSWTNNNTILSIYDSARIMETDLLGNVILDLDLEKLGLPYKVHHEVFYDPAGNIVTITHDSARYDLRKFGGEREQYLTADGILVLSRTGKIIWKWNLLQVEDPLQFKGKINLHENWGHANSIALDADGNYLISFRDFNQVWKIDKNTGEVIWKFGEGGTLRPSDPQYNFIRQHSIHFNPRGELMMFDNGELKARPNSRVLSFQINEREHTVTPAIYIELPRALSSYRMCSAEMIGEGRYLVCTTRKDATVTVVNDSGQILWKITADNASYRAYFIKNPFKNYIQAATRSLATLPD